MEILSKAGDALLSAAFEWLLHKLDDRIKSNDLQEEVQAELQKWKYSFPQIRAVLNDAEEKQITNSSVKIWLHDLRDLAYDMEDILDGFQADVQRSTVMAKPHQGCTSNFTLKCLPCFKHNDFVFDSDTISKVKEVAKRLQSMIEQSRTLCLVSSSMQVGVKPERAPAGWVPTTPQLESHVYGRGGDKEAILQKLLNGEGGSEGYCVLPIVGMGGIGKTTLARQVYGAVEQEKFQLKAWVCISDQFDVISITKNILIELTKGGCDLQNPTLNLLQEKLKEQLSNKKFLLVLDDVWNEECNLWDILQIPFKSGAPGSIIIVTTRNEHVAEIMGGKDSIYHLKVLEDDKCLSILAQDALGVGNFDAHPSLKDVGQEMAKMCRGLPLAAKILGGFLRGKRDPREWKYILNNKMWKLQGDKSSILPALMLSYHHLPSHLKQCFAYCAMFPKDHQFDKEELILLWMAEGLLRKHPGDENQMVDNGHQYFSELLSRAFFQHSSNNKWRYVMHDLIHDLAQNVAGETCYNLENMLEAKKEKLNFEKTRHLSFYCQWSDFSQRFEVLNKMKGLRTFIQIDSLKGNPCLSNRVVHDWLVKLRCLRALSLQNYQIRKLPDSIGEYLKCLRYLNLSGTTIETLPESIGFLMSLQTLLLRNCNKFCKFPATIGNLNDLHYLDIVSTPSLKDMPREIANLKNLLILPKFIVGKTKGLRLSDLKNLLHLQGCLSILDLQNVSDILDARQSGLHMIEALDVLELQWTSDFGNSREGSDIEAEVLSFLSPHQNLKVLEICGYGGERFPSWIGDPLFCNLSHLTLSSCRSSTLLPSVEQLPALKELVIEGMDAIETVEFEFYGHDTFTSLQMLKFHNMLNLEKWAFLTSFEVEFSCLKDLEIVNCPKLTGKLPIHLSSLINLVIRGCPELTCSSRSLPSLEKLCIASCKQVLLESMVDLTTLNRLEISNISGLGCLPKSFTDSLTALEDIRIEGCQELTYLWEEGADIKNLARLERMEIKQCPLLVSMSREEQGIMPPNVKYLSLYGCWALKCLPDGMMTRANGSNNMVRLKELRIWNCPCLESFPRGTLPATCLLLMISDCAKVESLPEGILVQDGDDINNNIENLEITALPSLNFIPSDGQLPAALKKFQIINCLRLESISERMLQQCTRLEGIEISGCVNLKSLSFNGLSNLTGLYIRGCDALESFQEMPESSLSIPNIKFFEIRDCQNLKSLPNKMYNLTSLQILYIQQCPGIESIPEGGLPQNLTRLTIDCENLKQPMREWGLRTLTSLRSFTIAQICPPNNNLLPPSLTFLWIKDVQNLKSIPRGLLQNLNSLKQIWIWNCPKLQSLPREGLPPLLGELDIYGCPLLKVERFQEKGEYWPLIAHIPRVKIDDFEVNPL